MADGKCPGLPLEQRIGSIRDGEVTNLGPAIRSKPLTIQPTGRPVVADFCICSKCGADLRGPAIPPEHLHHYGGDALCPYSCGEPHHYSRIIGVYNINTDRTESWRCPDCGHETARRG